MRESKKHSKLCLSDFLSLVLCSLCSLQNNKTRGGNDRTRHPMDARPHFFSGALQWLHCTWGLLKLRGCRPALNRIKGGGQAEIQGVPPVLLP